MVLRHELEAAFLAIAAQCMADGAGAIAQAKGRPGLPHKMRKCIEQDVHIPDVTQDALKAMHPSKETLVVRGQQRLNHLGGVAEAFEGDPRPVDADLVEVLHVRCRLPGLFEAGIDRGQCSCLRLVRCRLQCSTKPLDPPAKP